MMKKLLLTLLIFFGFTAITLGQSITMTTTSSSGTWSPETIIKTGATLTWTATGPITGSPVVINANDPTFDFSSNTGNGDITIEVTSSDGFGGLTAIDLWVDDSGNGGMIKELDVSVATSLTSLNTRYNRLETLDVSALPNLIELTVRGNYQLTNGLDLSNNTLLETLVMDVTAITSIDLSNNPSLTDIRAQSSRLTSAGLDQMIIDLDQHGEFNGTLNISNTTGNLTVNATTAYNSLLGRGWTITGNAPPVQNIQTITLTTTSSSTSWSPQSVVNNGATLTWEATGNGISEIINADDPTFDFSANDGSPINITITSNQGFVGLTTLDFCGGTSCEGGEVTNLDVSNATELTTLNTRYNELNSLDVSANTALTELVVRGNNQLSSGIDISALTNLTVLWADVTALSSIDVSNNDLLTSIWLHEANLTSAQLDKLLIDLDANGASDGELRILNNPEELSTAATTAYNNLINRNWTIDADPPGVPVNQEIEVSINGSIILNNGSYNMGDVVIGDSEDITVTISNKGSLPLQIFGYNLIDKTGPGNFNQGQINKFIITAAGDSPAEYIVTFDNTTNTLEGLASVRISILNNDADEGGFPPSQLGYFIDLTVNSITVPTNEAIEVTGNGNLIANGSITPEISNDTDFGQVLINSTETKTYTITNTGTDPLTITGISKSLLDSEFANPSNFSLPLPATLAQNETMTFDVEFSSAVVGDYQTEIEISSSDSNNNPFRFIIAASAVTNVTAGDIMISQYYDGINENDNWLEIMNISDQTIPANTYYVNLYLKDKAQYGIIETATPDLSYLISQALLPGEVLLIKKASASLPLAGNIGPANQVTSSVCDFSNDGTHLLLISPSNGSDAYHLREDIIGNIGNQGYPADWGLNVSYAKGGCASETPHLEFDLSDWINVPLNEVDDADPNSNVALGRQWIGITEFNGSTWSNGISDRTRNARITTSLSAASQSIEACTLEIPAGIDVDFDSNGATYNSLVIYGDLIVDGNLTIGDTESLVTYDDNASLDVITKIEKSQNKTDIHQTTYWSSPVIGAQISSIFAGVNPDRIFRYTPGNPNPAYAGSKYRYWHIASGSMGNAIGYSAEGSTTGVQTLTFTGVPNNGNIVQNVFYEANPTYGQDENFNLLGNPYPAAIDIELFLIANSIIGEIAIWDNGGPDGNGEFNQGNYIYYNNGGSSAPEFTKNIASGQGFMARAAGLGQIRFSNTMKMVDANNQFYKQAATKGAKHFGNDEDKLWLELSDDNYNYNSILIGFLEEATDGFDTNYDASGFDSGNSRLFSRIESMDNKLVIQSLGKFEESKIVKLGVDAQNKGTYTIAISGTKGEFGNRPVYLVDQVLGLTYDLSKGNYEFDVDEAGTYDDRFIIRFNSQSLGVEDGLVSKNDFIVSNATDGFKIESRTVVNDIKIYDMLGRLIVHKTPKQSSFNVVTRNVKPGTVLIIDATLEGGAKVNRKTVKF